MDDTHFESQPHSGFEPDRFTDLHQVGFGRHAVVVHAWDVDLERAVVFKTSHSREFLLELDELERVAKVDLPTPLANHAAELRARLELGQRYTLLREAGLLAKIDHPNVVTVHDIGKIADGSDAVLMPFLGGGSLQERELPERWEDVLDILLQVGRGLEAMHAEGIIHRDLKPNNIMFDGKGRPVIVDLGLACLLDDAEAMADWVGSLGYMSPEVARQERRDVRDDLYTFCVVAFEAFYGDLPFATLRDRDAGRPQALTREAGMSAAVHAVILRGLAPDPDDRWPDMTTLLRELERARDQTPTPVPERRRPWPAIVAWTAAAASIGFALSVPDVRASNCDGLASELEVIWNDDVRDELRDALGTRKAGDGLQDWVSRWVAVRGQECEAARSRGDELGPTPCSASLRDRFVSTIRAFETPHLREQLSFTTVLAELPAPEHCLDHPDQADWGNDGPPGLRDIDVEVEALIRMGDLEVARARLDTYTTTAQAQGFKHASARAVFWRAELRRLEGDLDGAATDFGLAYALAWELGLGVFGAEVQMKLAAVAGAKGELPAVDAFASSARGVFESYRPERVAEVLQEQGLALIAGPDDARERGLTLLGRAVELREVEAGTFPGTHERLSRAHESYAKGLIAVGRPADAIEHLDLALDVHQDEYGHGTWRTRGILRQKFLALVTMRRHDDAGIVETWILSIDHEEQDWRQYIDDASWLASQYIAAGDAARALRPLHAAHKLTRELGMKANFEVIEALLSELQVDELSAEQ